MTSTPTHAVAAAAGTESDPAPLTVGAVFVDSLGRRDFVAMAGCLAPGVRFRALLPPREVDVVGPAAALAEFQRWFGDPSERCELLDATIGAVGSRLYMSWRVRMTPAGEASESRVASQHVFASGGDTLTTMSLLCSGFVPG